MADYYSSTGWAAWETTNFTTITRLAEGFQCRVNFSARHAGVCVIDERAYKNMLAKWGQ
jgi:hypothetical protein